MAQRAMAQETKEASEVPAQKRGSKLIWIIILVLLLLGGGGFWGWTYMKGENKSDSEGSADSNQTPPAVVGLSPFVVNLIDDADIPRYLKIDFDMELRPGSETDEVDAKVGELRDAVIVLLTSKRSKDLVTMEGKDRLRDEIITRLNGRLRNATVGRIFFKEFIIQ